MSILNETQEQRDVELAKILDWSLEDVQNLGIATPDGLRVSDGVKPDNLEDLYKDYKFINFPAYLKTLMKTSANRRHPALFKFLKETKNKICLDFGSGSGTHSIALLENNNHVDMLDVPGKFQDFANKRVLNRGWDNRYFRIIGNDYNLLDNYYDIVVCTDVIEHVPSPIKELKRIHKSMKQGGLLHLLVSTMRKPSSGHFDSSIDEWLQLGKQFISDNFIEIKPTIYRKNEKFTKTSIDNHSIISLS